MSSNCLVFHTSGGISSSPAAFLFSIFLRIESSSSCVNGPSLMSTCSLTILVIGSCVTFGGFPYKFLKFYFHRCSRSCWQVALRLALAVLFLSAHFVYCLLCNPRLSIFNRVPNLIDLVLWVFCLFFR